MTKSVAVTAFSTTTMPLSDLKPRRIALCSFLVCPFARRRFQDAEERHNTRNICIGAIVVVEIIQMPLICKIDNFDRPFFVDVSADNVRAGDVIYPRIVSGTFLEVFANER